MTEKKLFDTEDKKYLRKVLDTLPIPIFLMDSRLNVVDANKQAKEFVEKDDDIEIKRICGEALDCLYALKLEEGCGATKFCKECAIREAIKKVESGEKIFRAKCEMLLYRKRKVVKAHYLITVSPLEWGEHRLFLFAMEDVSEMVQLRKILPICANCKKIRMDEDYWEQVDTYMNKFYQVEFSHGLCPDCAEKLYPEFKKR